MHVMLSKSSDLKKKQKKKKHLLLKENEIQDTE